MNLSYGDSSIFIEKKLMNGDGSIFSSWLVFYLLFY